MNDPTPLDRFYSACNPAHPLPVGDARYVELHKARGVNWRRPLEKALSRNEASVQLVSGFSGDGKTTEFYRLQEALKTRKRGKIAVAYVNAENYVNQYQYSVVDVLMAIIIETSKSLRDDYAIDLQPGYLGRRFQEVKGALFSEIEIEQLKIGAGADWVSVGANIGLKTRSNDQVSGQLNQLLGEERRTLAEAFKEVITNTALPKLRGLGWAHLVIIVDGLEKLLQTEDREGLEQVFVHGANLLGDLGTHTLLTIPVSLARSPAAGALEDAYGTATRVVPAARIPDFLEGKVLDEEREEAWATFRELVRVRLPEGTTIEQAFDSQETLDAMIALSGGHPRRLLSLIRETTLHLDEFPLTAEAFKEVRKETYRSAARQISRDAELEVVAFVAHHHQLPSEDEAHATAMLLLQNLHLLSYHNSIEYYGISPALLEVPAVKDAVRELVEGR